MLQELLDRHLESPKNTTKMFELAKEYDRLEQGAAAVSFYIRTADLETKDKLLQYKCMILAGKCYDRQRGRDHTVKGIWQLAVALLPKRPEAHYFLAKLAEKNHDWRYCLIHSKLALDSVNDYDDIDVEFPGIKELEYMIALSEWSISGTEKGRIEFFNLLYRRQYDQEFNSFIENILTNKIGFPDAVQYQKDEDFYRLNYTFPGVEKIKTNYSKHFQDMFILALTAGKEEGTYLEIGAGDPFIHNNTALLEEKFDWKGLSVEWSAHLAYDFSKRRKNPVVNLDATTINFEELLIAHCFDQNIDFLQIDCDEASLSILKNIPFDTYKFKIITFEHDAYRLGDEIRAESRKILGEKGYQLLVSNVCFRPGFEYEDWWIHPDMVHPHFKNMISPQIKTFFWDYMIKPIKDI